MALGDDPISPDPRCLTGKLGVIKVPHQRVMGSINQMMIEK